MYYCTHHLCLCTSLLALPANFPRCCSNLPLSQLANLSPVPRHNNNNDINNAFASMILPGPLTPPSKSRSHPRAEDAASPPVPNTKRPSPTATASNTFESTVPASKGWSPIPRSRPRAGGARRRDATSTTRRGARGCASRAFGRIGTGRWGWRGCR